MANSLDLSRSVIAAWRTNCRITEFLVQKLPDRLWDEAIPGIKPRRTLRLVLAHLHNARSRWLRTLGLPFGIAVPPLVDLRRVGRRELLAALRKSGNGIESLLELGLGRGGEVPASPAYTWRNLPLDVGHVLTYFAGHEAHHRGQIIMAARQMGHRLPPSVTNGLWWWTQRPAAGKKSRRVRGSTD